MLGDIAAFNGLIPARVRRRVTLTINGRWYVGTAGAAFFPDELLQNLATAEDEWELARLGRRETPPC